jgi:hypothetical protein
MSEPSLAELLDGPTFTVRVGGRDYGFSEVPVSSLLALEGWIRENTPHPIESIKPYLAGLEPGDRQRLLEDARRDAAHWPPRIGTSAGAAALLGSGDMGQIETLYHGLLVHHPGATRDHARGLYRKLKQAMRREVAASEDGESPTVRRIFAAIFGMLDEQGEPAIALPKGGTAAPNGASGGTSSSAPASSIQTRNPVR